MLRAFLHHFCALQMQASYALRYSEPDIFEEAKKGDELCIRAIDEMADVLGRGIANICYVMNPEVVVLGGGVMAQEEYLRGRIEASSKM